MRTKSFGWMNSLSVGLFLFVISSCHPRQDFTMIEATRTQGGSVESVLKELDQKSFESEPSVIVRKECVEWRAQLKEGFPVLDSWAKVIFDENSEAREVRGQVLQLETQISLPKEFEAGRGLSKSLKSHFLKLMGAQREDFIRPAFRVHNHQLIPVWQVVALKDSGQLVEAHIDAIRHRILKQFETGSHFGPGSAEAVSLPAWVFPYGPIRSGLDEVQIQELQRGLRLRSSVLEVSSAAGDHVRVDSNPLRFQLNDRRFDQVQVFYTLNRAHQWFQSQLGVTWMGRLAVETSIGFPNRTNAAFYHMNRIRLGEGDGEIYKDIPKDPSIVVHEAVHALVDRVARLPFQGEGGSINEGYADFIAASYLNSPLMGEASYLQGPYRRSLEEPKRWQDLTGGLYNDSQVISSLLWALRKQVGEEVSLGLALNVLKELYPDETLESFRKKIIQRAELDLSTEDREKFFQVMSGLGWPSHT